MTTKLTADNIDLDSLGGTFLSTPKIEIIDYPNDDQATDIAGGGNIVLTGNGFVSGCQVLVDTTYANSVTFYNSTTVSFIAPAKSVGTYILYLVNPNGGTAISIPGISYSDVPVFSTGAGTLGSQYETLSFSSAIAATGDVPITYAVTNGTLPGGLSLNANTGTISGNLSSVASATTYTFTITASDAELQDVNRTFSITVNPDVVTWNSPADGTTITQYETYAVTQTLNATSLLSKTITYTANVLPGGLSISGNAISGNINAGESSRTSLITATSAESNKTANRSLLFVINPDVVTWATPSAATTAVSQYETTSYSLTLSASSATGKSISYSANALPAGITLTGNSLSGTLTTTGSTTTLLTATAATTNRTATRIINWTVDQDVVTWSSPANSTVYAQTEGDVINISLSASSAAGYSISYSATGLPNGLSVSGSAITGTIANGAAGSYSVTLTATAATSGRTASISISFTVASLEVNAQWWMGGGGDAFGISTVERMLYSSDTSTATARGTSNLTNATGLGATGTRTYGWFAGTAQHSGTDRITWATDTGAATARGVLGVTWGYRPAEGTDTYGWWTGGYTTGSGPAATSIHRITWASDSGTGSSRGTLIRANAFHCIVGNDTYSWVMAGSDGTGSYGFSNIDRMTYSSDTNTLTSRSTTVNYRYYHAGISSTTAGYTMGGRDEVGANKQAMRLTFSTDTSSAIVRGALSEYQTDLMDCGDGNSTYGFIAGGGLSTATTRRFRMTYSSDTTTMSIRGYLIRTAIVKGGCAGQV